MSKSKKRVLIAALVLLIIFACYIVWRNNGKKRLNTDSQKLTIVSTLFPTYEIAKEVGGQYVSVSLLLPPGVESHDFEPKPSDFEIIQKADLLIYTGKFMEPWIETLLDTLHNSVQIIDTSQGIKLEKSTVEADMYDPHIWLDFTNAKKMTETITQGLMDKDPVHSTFYQSQSEAYKQKLTLLDNQYQNSLKTCASRTIIHGGHYAFGYLTKRYQLTYKTAQGISPDSEPTVKDLIELVTMIRNEKIQYVFYEELATPKIAQTLANETDAKLLLLNAAHNISKQDFKNNSTFIDIMVNNLHNLETGLQCQT